MPRTGRGARSTSRRVLSRPGRFSRRAASLARLRRRPREERPEQDSCTRARRRNAQGSRCPSRARRPRRGATWPCPRRCSGRASWRVARCAGWRARWRGLDRGAGAARGADGRGVSYRFFVGWEFERRVRRTVHAGFRATLAYPSAAPAHTVSCRPSNGRMPGVASSAHTSTPRSWSASRSACDPVLGGAPDAEAGAEDMRTSGVRRGQRRATTVAGVR